LEERALKKNKGDSKKKKGSQDPYFYNDQIGENAGEGRMMKEYKDNKRNK